MKVLLFNPPKYHERLYSLRDEICFQDVTYVPFPIRLAQVAPLLQRIEGCEVLAMDANAEDLSWKQVEGMLPAADVLVVQSAAGLIKHDLRIAEIAKGRAVGQIVLVENVLAPIFPDRILEDFPHLDVVVRGQPEAILPLLLRNVSNPEKARGVCVRRNGKVICTPLAAALDNLDELPFMAYDLFSPAHYTIGYLDAPMHEHIVPGIRLRTTRDCPYSCPFCLVGSSEKRGYTRRWRAMSPRRVVDELEYVVRNHGVNAFFFWDETFTLDKKRAREMCDIILERKLDIIWRCLTRIDCVDEMLLRKMAQAGCKLIEYGIEAGSEHVRRRLHKRFDDRTAVEVVRETRRAGIRANCDIIVGMPWETRATLRRSLSLAKKLQADNVHLTMAFPIPETEFYRIAAREGLIEVEDIYDLMVQERVRVGASPIIRTRSLSSAELDRAWQEMRKKIDRYYLMKNLLLRPWDTRGMIENALAEGNALKLISKAARSGLRRLMGRTGSS